MKLKFYFYSFFALLLTILILTFPSDCLALALNGLNLWFERMIPTLFPFMVLSGIIIRMNLTDTFVKALNPVLGRLFGVRASCVYGMIIGFLCGFPMGAHVAAGLYKQRRISRAEASFLLSFCNNIGPVYFLSFVLPSLGISDSGSYVLSFGLLKNYAPFLFGMYGLPFLYGLLLRHTLFKTGLSSSGSGQTQEKSLPLLAAVDDSVFSALSGIARLGGYMIFFNLLFILPVLAARALSLSETLSARFAGSLGCLLEITGGIMLIGKQMPLLVLCILPFGGLSCIAQTYSMIRDTDLSIREYIMHKMILTAITVLYYLLVWNSV